MGASMSSELKTCSCLLAAIWFIGLAGALPLYADSCLTLKPANSTTKITVSQDEGTVTIRIAGTVSVSGDIAPYVVSSDAGGVVWTAVLGGDTSLSTSRAGGVVKVCQSGAVAAAAIPPPPAASPPTNATTTPPPAPAAPAATLTQPAPDKAALHSAPPGTAEMAAAPAAAAAEASSDTAAHAEATCAPPQTQPAPGAAQTADQKKLSDPEKVVALGVTNALKEGTLADAQVRFAQDYAPYILCLAKPTIPRRLLSDAEEKRIDQQVTSTQPSTGTNVASKGSVPWLLGFAAESGALTQSTSNNIMTFNGTPANIVKALKAKDYLASYSVGEDTPLVKWLFTPLSFSISLNVAQSSSSNGTSGGGVMMAAATPDTTTAPATGTLAGYTLRYAIWNHRDARERRYQKQWNSFVDANAPAMLAAIRNVVLALSKNPKYSEAFKTWRQETEATINSKNMTPEQIANAFDLRAQALRKIIGGDNAIQSLLDDAATSIEKYADARNDILTNISNSTAIAFEYTETQQSTLLGNPVTVTDSGSTSGNPIPNLSTFNFILEKGSVGFTQFTANASTTIYNSIPVGTHIGRVRDYRAAIQADIPLPEIKNVGMPVFTFSGLFLSLLNQPLGQMVVVNDVPISLTGNIWLFQSKISIKVKNSGVKIPVALTYANRTELNKESDVRGSIGLSYNLDSLFANSK